MEEKSPADSHTQLCLVLYKSMTHAKTRRLPAKPIKQATFVGRSSLSKDRKLRTVSPFGYAHLSPIISLQSNVSRSLHTTMDKFWNAYVKRLMRSIHEKYTGMADSLAKNPPMSMRGRMKTGAKIRATSGFGDIALIKKPKEAAQMTSKYRFPRTGKKTTGSHEMFKRDHEIRKKSVGTQKSKTSSEAMRAR